MRTKTKAVKPKKVLWEYVVEPIIKPTYWDKALPTAERRAKAKRLPVESATVEQDADEGSSEDRESDNEPICKTLTLTSSASTVEKRPSKAVKRKKVLWDYVVEPVVKATYWDTSLPTEERRAKAKRLTVQELHGEGDSSEASSSEVESDNQPICKSGFSTKLATNAIGLKVARKIGRGAVMTGEITAYNVDVNKYTVLYSDGDAHSTTYYDEAEYLKAVHLYRDLKRKKEEAEDHLFPVEDLASSSEAGISSGSDSSEKKPLQRKRKPRKNKLPPDNISSVKSESVAGKELVTMSATAIEDVNLKLVKRLQKVKNKEVTACVLQEKYQDIVEEQTRRQLQQNVPEVCTMVHAPRPTLGDLADALNRVKVGDWVEVEGDFTTGYCSNGGIGCVSSAYNISEGPSVPDIPWLDVHYLLTNTREKRVSLGRVTVIPMPYRTERPATRTRKCTVQQASKIPTVRLIPGYADLTPIGQKPFL